jgi:hypothetical protein
MIDIEVMVDTIQHGKKQFIKKYMKHPELSRTWNQYVDTQSAFVKQAFNTFETCNLLVVEKIIGSHGEKLFNPFGIDWYEAGWDSLVKKNNKK